MIYSCIIIVSHDTFGSGNSILAIHAVDFGMGFCSKLLPGALYNIFFDTVGTVKTYLYLLVLLVLFFIGLSFILEKFLLKINAEHRKTALIILAFFLTGPGTFAIHVYLPGMLDMYWVFCALMFFIFLSNKYLRPLIFIPFVLCVTVYFASLICFIPFFVIILLYEISYTDTKKEKIKLWIILIISSVFALGLSVYFAAFESDNLVYTMEEFNKIYSEKGVSNFFYFNQSLYKDIVSYYLDQFAVFELKTNSPLEKFIWEVTLRINYNLSRISLSDKLIIFALIVPIVCLILSFMINQIKINFSEKQKLRAFANICSFALPLFAICASVFFSEDFIRWTGHVFLTLFASFLFILSKDRKACIRLDEWISKIPFTAIILYFAFYATTIYSPYYSG